MKKPVASRIHTDTELISTLIENIKRGEIKVPQFQRKFVWKDSQALDLLDSIANSYPVGSLLIWRTKEKLNIERNIGEFTLPETDDMDPTDYVLDGQQRLTVIYSCLGASEMDDGFSVCYDLETEIFERISNRESIHLFPLRRMFNVTKLLNFRAALQTSMEAEKYQNRLDQLIRSFTEYRIPVVTLKDLSVEEVCPIFERINSSGTKLSTYDLMVAATWSSNFDLNEEVDQVQNALKPKGFSDIERATVLKCLSAVKVGSIKESALKTLRNVPREEMRELIDECAEALKKSVDLLSTQFRVHSWDFLSYEAIIVVLSYIYCRNPKLTSIQVTRIDAWFWRSSFGERYKVGGEGFVSRDLQIVEEFVVHGRVDSKDFGSLPRLDEWQTIAFRSNVSRSRAFILALAAQKPMNLSNGAKIDTDAALSIFNKKQFHHIYPRAFLKRSGTKLDDNLLINICMLSASENNLISDDDPQEYLPRCARYLGSRADEVFASNLLPKPSEFDYTTASYAEFIRARSQVVSTALSNLCGM